MGTMRGFESDDPFGDEEVERERKQEAAENKEYERAKAIRDNETKLFARDSHSGFDGILLNQRELNELERDRYQTLLNGLLDVKKELAEIKTFKK